METRIVYSSELLTALMPYCCRGNVISHCKNSSCAKVGRLCTDCQLSKKQQCSNLPTRDVTSELARPGQQNHEEPLGRISPPETAEEERRKDSSQAWLESHIMPTTMPPSNNVTLHETHDLRVRVRVPHTDDYLLALYQISSQWPTFSWGSTDSVMLGRELKLIYAEVIHWRKNSYWLPQGNADRAFSELTEMFNAPLLQGMLWSQWH